MRSALTPTASDSSTPPSSTTTFAIIHPRACILCTVCLAFLARPRVVMLIVAVQPFPYMAAAAGPFNISIDSTSPELMSRSKPVGPFSCASAGFLGAAEIGATVRSGEQAPVAQRVKTSMATKECRMTRMTPPTNEATL